MTDIIHHSLVFYCSKIGGWSGLVRTTAEKYSLPDPAQYMMHPWRADRWRAHCRDVIADYWDRKLKQAAEVMNSLYMLDVPSLSIMKPAKV